MHARRHASANSSVPLQRQRLHEAVPLLQRQIHEAAGLTGPDHPRTNGQVERMNRIIREATVKRFHYDSHGRLRTHLIDLMAAYNLAGRPKTLSGLTAYEYIARIWTPGQPQTRSIASARPIPTPMHKVARPRRPPLVSS